MKATRLLSALVLSACATSGSFAAPIEVVNSLRTGGCASSAGAPALKRVSRLDEVGRRIARGETLAAALDGAGYRAKSSTFMRLTGPRSDAQIAQMLRAHHCARIADPAFREGGVARRGDSTWIVLAAPFAPPSARDTAVIGARVLELVNKARTAARRCGKRSMPAVAPLAREAHLDTASLTYAGELARLDRFDHLGADGSAAPDRVGRTGYRWRVVGENLAAGPTTAEEVVQGWLASPGHCENLMDARFTQMGIGFAFSATSRNGMYWVQVFAVPR